MPLPKIILVPTDFGEPSEAALDYALDYARVFGSEIVLMHAYEIPVIGFPDGAVVATAELTAKILEGAQIGLDREIKDRESSGVVVRGVIKQGDAPSMINETAREVGAGLICMGTHGRKGLPRMLLGSVAEKVVRTAHAPVLTVHPSDVVKAEVGPSETQAGATPTTETPAASPQTIQSGREPPAPSSHR